MSIGNEHYESSIVATGTTWYNSDSRPYKVLLNRTLLTESEISQLSLTVTSASSQAILSELYNNTEVSFTFLRVAAYHYSGTELYGTLSYSIFPMESYDAEYYAREDDWWAAAAPQWYRHGSYLINMQGPYSAAYVTLPSSEWNVRNCYTITYDSTNDLYMISTELMPVGSIETRTYTGLIPFFPHTGEDALAQYLLGAYIDMSDQINPDIGDKKGILSNPDSFISILECTDTQLKMFKDLCNVGLFAGNVGQFLISYKLMYLPGTLPMSATATIFSRTIGLTTFDFDAQYVTYQMNVYNLGNYSFTEHYNSFLDYAPYTKINIYLPFCGYQSIDPSLVMGGTFNLKCVVDMLSGNVTYYGTVTKDGLTNTLYTWLGNCSIEVPMTMDDYGSKAMRLLTGVLTTSATISSGGAGVVLAGANTTSNVLQSDVTVKNACLAGNAGLGGALYPYIIIERATPRYPVNYNQTVGRPCMKYLSLAVCSGYTKVDDVHLTGMTGAFKEEIDELEALLKEGVIF